MAGAWIEAFRAGKHTSAEGHTKEYSVDDLNAIATTYNAQKDHEAPLVYGHPEHDKPAHGWIKELKVMGDRLWAFAECVNEGTVAAVSAKAFKKVSIALYANGLLRHVGLLGSMPPAVKGLAPVAFSAGDSFEEFMWASDEYRVPTIGRILSDLRDWFIGKHGVEEADKALDKEAINALQGAAASGYIPDSLIDSQFAESKTKKEEEEHMELAELDRALNAMKESILTGVDTKIATMQASFSEQVGKVSTALETMEASHKATFQETRKTAFAAFCDGLIVEGKVLPGERESLLLEYADLIQADTALTFAEGTPSLSDKMKARLAARVVTIRPSRTFASRSAAASPSAPQTASVNGLEATFGENDINLASLEIDTQIRSYAEEHKTSYDAACIAVMGSAN